MSLRYRMFGLPCAFCDRPVYFLEVHTAAVRTVHLDPTSAHCVRINPAVDQPRTGMVERSFSPPVPSSPVRLHRGAA